MQITVKSVKCLKKGTNDYGPWALYKMESTDGKVYSTLAEGAEAINPGSVIEPDAITLDEKHEGQFQFKKFTLITGGAAGTASDSPEDTMSKQDWAEKDRLERRSRESIAAFQGLAQIASSPDLVMNPDNRLKYVEGLGAGLDWASSRFSVKTEATKTRTEAPPTTSTTSGEFKNLGEFLTKVTKELDIKRDEIAEKLSINDVKEITDFKEAWETLTGKEPEKEAGGEVTAEDLPF